MQLGARDLYSDTGVIHRSLPCVSRSQSFRSVWMRHASVVATAEQPGRAQDLSLTKEDASPGRSTQRCTFSWEAPEKSPWQRLDGGEFMIAKLAVGLAV